jgi:hypothetical protein
MITKKVLLLLVLFLTVSFCFAQYSWTPAKVYLKNGSVHVGQASLNKQVKGGFVGLMIPKGKVSFKKSKKSKKKKFLAEKVDSVVFTVSYIEKEGKNKIKKTRQEKYLPYYLGKKKKRLRFLQLIVNGEVKLLGRTVFYEQNNNTTASSHNGIDLTNPASGAFYLSNPNHNELFVKKENEIPELINDRRITKSFRNRAKSFFKDCVPLVRKIENREYRKEDLITIVQYYNNSCN